MKLIKATQEMIDSLQIGKIYSDGEFEILINKVTESSIMYTEHGNNSTRWCRYTWKTFLKHNYKLSEKN